MSAHSASILFVDDERPVLNSLKRLFRPTGHKIHIAGSGAEGLALLGEHSIDVVVSDMRMPEMDGAQFLSSVAENWPATTRMLLTGYADLSSAIDAINNGSISRYLTKPWQDADIVMCIEQAIETQRLTREKTRLEAVTARQNEELKALNENLESRVEERTREIEAAQHNLHAAHAALQAGYSATIEVFSRLIQSRSGLGGRASVAEDARAVAAMMGFDASECRALYEAGLLCDIGKLSLPDESVQTPYTTLDVNSQRAYNRHPVVAEATLLSLEPLADSAAIIRHHCERHDGTGFPDKLAGDAIPPAARILAVTKAFADLQDGRIFEERMTAREAREFLAAEKDKRYASDVVDAFLAWLDNSERRADEVRERKVELESLRPGMTTSRDLCDENGVLILAKGQEISNSMLSRLERLQEALQETLVVHVEDARA